jgi:hypothetical protein
MAYGLIYGQVNRQVNAVAYVHDFQVLSLLCLLCIPTVFLFRKVAGR